jgi:hypothetical protein
LFAAVDAAQELGEDVIDALVQAVLSAVVGHAVTYFCESLSRAFFEAP